MYKSAYGGVNRSNPAKVYLMKEILESTPQMLILKIYDFAILNCQKRDTVKTNNAIQELINALRFDDEKAKEISIGLLRLYQFCQYQMRKGNTEIVKRILTELRDTWKEAFSKM